MNTERACPVWAPSTRMRLGDSNTPSPLHSLCVNVTLTLSCTPMRCTVQCALAANAESGTFLILCSRCAIYSMKRRLCYRINAALETSDDLLSVNGLPLSGTL